MLEVSNQNFNDIRRIIELIKWHNSFIALPEELWSHKPTIIGASPPKHKFAYVVRLVQHKILENKPKTLLALMDSRRAYIRLFDRFRNEPTSRLREELEQVENKMEVWRVQEYRRFCILRAKKKAYLKKAIKNLAVSQEDKAVLQMPQLEQPPEKDKLNPVG